MTPATALPPQSSPATRGLEAWFSARVRVTVWGRWTSLDILYHDYCNFVRVRVTRASFAAWLRDDKGAAQKAFSGQVLVSGVDLHGAAA